MTTKGQLIAARERIAKGWTQGALARQADGYPVCSWDKDAVQWCTSGALKSASLKSIEAETAAIIALTAVLPEAFAPSTAPVLVKIQLIQALKDITSFNDHPNTTQDDVLALYDRAIKEVT